MNKKIVSFLLSALTLGALNAQTEPAAAPAPASSYSITLDIPYTTKYVFRGVQYAKSSLQPSVKLTSGSFYAGVWANQPLTDNIDNEIDFFGGYGFKLNDSWSLDVGATLYYYPQLDTSSGADDKTFEGYVGANGTFGSYTVGLYAYNDFTLKAFTLQGTFGYSAPINDKASLNLLGTIGNVSPDGGDSYTYYGIGATLPYKLAESATLTFGLQYASHNIDMVDDGHFWGTVGLTFVF